MGFDTEIVELGTDGKLDRLALIAEDLHRDRPIGIRFRRLGYRGQIGRRME